MHRNDYFQSSVSPGSTVDRNAYSATRRYTGNIFERHWGNTSSSVNGVVLPSKEMKNTATLPERMDPIFVYEQSLTQKLKTQLATLAESDASISAVALSALMAWTDLAVAMAEKLPVPNAAVGANGQIMFAWDKDALHFELEVFPEQHGEFFSINHDTDEMWEYDYTVGEAIPEEVKAQLRQFLGL